MKESAWRCNPVARDQNTVTSLVCACCPIEHVCPPCARVCFYDSFQKGCGESVAAYSAPHFNTIMVKVALVDNVPTITKIGMKFWG